ncbi:MAG: POT family proton-dependent oligopeptide transporter [Gammaproteobacteria bacterium]|jgi:POT family proton-dependent oligopeptide transporter
MTNASVASDKLSKDSVHPRGLYTLFFTEMWERFSYYGMRALLVLFMTASIADGGLGFDDVSATAIYGLYTAAVYLVALPGGWIADRLIGAQRCVWYGGITIMCGHFILAIPAESTFYIGLIVVVLGTGLLKPNVSAIVGELYPQGGAACDAGYTIFYMGINLGAVLGPLVCSALGESSRFGWHYGFAAAGFGMLLWLIQYRLSSDRLGNAGRLPAHLGVDAGKSEAPKYAWLGIGVGLGLIVLVSALALTGVIHINALSLAQMSTYVIALLAVAFFAYMYLFGRLDSLEKKRVGVIIILVMCAAVFWSGFEQTGSSLNLFAERYTDRIFFGFEIPAGWFQSVNAMFILICSPFIAALWVNLARRNLNPSIPTKFALGLIQLGLGFLVMVFAAKLVAAGDNVLPTWLILTYLLHTTGELCLSPVGLSAICKLAPKRFASQMMGVWFLGFSLGNLIAGLLAGRFDPNSLEQMPNLYLQIVSMTIGAGILVLVFLKPIKKMIGDIE